MSDRRHDTEPSASPRILVVDDDRRVRDLLEIALTAQGFTVATASDGDEAVRHALANRADLVVLDVRLPKKSGLDVCDQIVTSCDPVATFCGETGPDRCCCVWTFTAIAENDTRASVNLPVLIRAPGPAGVKACDCDP